ncbi:hypothetical protein [uncultured Roseovarius sp.]|uniref:hypothetical protein n=1 Tax=uncultured Roseovarius sp. TaxID=293344 RepID=UPI00261D3EA5|nr:hypothetical protein [uncultured Roseovarius sp.]
MLVQGGGDWIAHADEMISLYSDPAILDHARTYEQAGIAPGEMAWPNGVDDSDRYRTAPFYSGDHLPSYQTGIRERASVGKKFVPQSGAAATANPWTCEITPPLPRSTDGTCRPPVVLEAIRLHEEAHPEKCLELTAGVGMPPASTFGRTIRRTTLRQVRPPDGR